MGFHAPLPTPVVFEHTTPPHPPWEYHTVVVDLREVDPLEEANLNELGREGWLLAGLFEDTRRSRLHYHFVRPA
jgi:hypothetical protein